MPPLDKYFQTQQQINSRIWKKVSARHLVELDEFERLEQELLEDVEIDLPSLCLEDHSAIVSEKESVVERMEVASDRSDFRTDFQTPDRITVNGVSLKTEVNAYRSRITELELECSKTKQLLSKLKREKDDQDIKCRKLIEEKDAHVQFVLQEYETKLLDLEAREKQLKKDKLCWEKHRRLSTQLPSKRERQEMELLHQKLKDQAQEFKQREQRMQLTHDRLHKKILDLEKRNRELQEEVKVLEQERAVVLEMKHKMKVSSGIQRPSIADPPSMQPSMLVPKATGGDLPHGRKTKASIELSGKKEIKNSAERESLGGLRKAMSAMDIKRPLRKSVSNSSLPDPTTIKDPIKIEMDRIQNELGLRRFIKETVQDGSRERVYHDSKLIYYPNKNYLVERNGIKTLYYSNGDTKTVCNIDKVERDGTTVYLYKDTGTVHCKYHAREVFQFSNGQIETKFPDGRLEVVFSDKTRKVVHGNIEEIYFPNGKHQITQDGNVKITYPDGTVEYNEPGVKIKMLKNGICKKVFDDGSEETTWPNGQTRVKDRFGKVVSVTPGHI